MNTLAMRARGTGVWSLMACTSIFLFVACGSSATVGPNGQPCGAAGQACCPANVCAGGGLLRPGTVPRQWRGVHGRHRDGGHLHERILSERCRRQLRRRWRGVLRGRGRRRRRRGPGHHLHRVRCRLCDGDVHRLRRPGPALLRRRRWRWPGVLRVGSVVPGERRRRRGDDLRAVWFLRSGLLRWQRLQRGTGLRQPGGGWSERLHELRRGRSGLLCRRSLSGGGHLHGRHGWRGRHNRRVGRYLRGLRRLRPALLRRERGRGLQRRARVRGRRRRRRRGQLPGLRQPRSTLLPRGWWWRRLLQLGSRLRRRWRRGGHLPALWCRGRAVLRGRRRRDLRRGIDLSDNGNGNGNDGRGLPVTARHVARAAA